MDRQAELARYLTIVALAAPAAVLVWMVFHRVFASLTQTEAVMGYVDPTTQTGIDLGYVVMFGGTIVFGAVALWAAACAASVWLRSRRER